MPDKPKTSLPSIIYFGKYSYDLFTDRINTTPMFEIDSLGTNDDEKSNNFISLFNFSKLLPHSGTNNQGVTEQIANKMVNGYIMS